MSEFQPETTMLVIKTKDGREVGRISATAPNKDAYIHELMQFYKTVHVEPVYEEDAGILGRLMSRN